METNFCRFSITLGVLVEQLLYAKLQFWKFKQKKYLKPTRCKTESVAAENE